MADLIVGEIDCSFSAILKILLSSDEGYEKRKWKDFALHLNLNKAWIAETDLDIHLDKTSVRTAYRISLEKWKNLNGHHANIGLLINILTELDRTEAIIKIKEKFSPTVNSEQSVNEQNPNTHRVPSR